MPLSTCQRLAHWTSCGTDIFASVAQRTIVLEVIVLQLSRATLPLVVASFSLGQRAVNTALSRVRIFIEHAIGGMKHYNILVHTFRNLIENFEDDVIGVCAGLWNLVLSY